jgi:hypothetical protein
VSIELDDPLLESGPPKAPGPIETRLRSIPTLVGDLRRSKTRFFFGRRIENLTCATWRQR